MGKLVRVDLQASRRTAGLTPGLAPARDAARSSHLVKRLASLSADWVVLIESEQTEGHVVERSAKDGRLVVRVTGGGKCCS